MGLYERLCSPQVFSLNLFLPTSLVQLPSLNFQPDFENIFNSGPHSHAFRIGETR